MAGDKLPGTHRSQPCLREASCRSPSSQQGTVSAAHQCYELQEPHGPLGTEKLEKGFQLGSAKTELLGHREKRGGVGFARCLGCSGGPGDHQHICGSLLGDRARGGMEISHGISPCMCWSFGEEQEAISTALSCPHSGD